ncbi:MAG: hypothetical protein AUJ97_02590 [Bacteroidetes bacterium CG2_30_32_10]|nr:MAG: hypothetical protein AUJ97_02590 [Bacteroidetes bacterium CG2_30_32_10]
MLLSFFIPFASFTKPPTINTKYNVMAGFVNASRITIVTDCTFLIVQFRLLLIELNSYSIGI